MRRLIHHLEYFVAYHYSAEYNYEYLVYLLDCDYEFFLNRFLSILVSYRYKLLVAR